MKCLSNMHDYFYGKDAYQQLDITPVTASIFSFRDKAFTGCSEVSVKIVQDFDLCVFGQFKARNQQLSSLGSENEYRETVQSQPG